MRGGFNEAFIGSTAFPSFSPGLLTQVFSALIIEPSTPGGSVLPFASSCEDVRSLKYAPLFYCLYFINEKKV